MPSGATQQADPNSPLMKAWTAYQETGDFKNSLIWATAENYAQAGAHQAEDPKRRFTGIQREQFTKGSLWAAFMEGFKAATERAAQLHEQINPASDVERDTKTPGAGAMAAVLEYRDRIRLPR